MKKYLNPNNEGVFIGPRISEWTKWKGLLTRLSRLTNMLHIVKTQFDDTRELMISNSWEMDDQGDNDAEDRQMRSY